MMLNPISKIPFSNLTYVTTHNLICLIQQNKCRNRSNIELNQKILIMRLISINLNQVHVVVLCCYLLDDWSHSLARKAPICPEVDQCKLHPKFPLLLIAL